MVFSTKKSPQETAWGCSTGKANRDQTPIGERPVVSINLLPQQTWKSDFVPDEDGKEVWEE